MPTAQSTSVTEKVQRGKKYQLSVNTYDRTATMIIALLILVGFAVLGLMIVFFADKFKSSVQPIPVVPVEATSANANQGLAAEPDPPGSEEAEELEDPQLEDMLETLTDAVTAKEVLLSDQDLEAEDIAGKGKGLGDARMAGTGNDGVIERVPRWERWKFRFEPKSPSEFAEWLDYNKIEIGVLGRDNLVHYAFDLSKSNKQTRVGEPTKDSRGYTSAADGPMPALTERLAREAGVAKEGNIVLLFYPFEVESILWTLENKYSDGRDVNTIRETVFTVVHDGSQFVFEVVDQRYF
ncbi:hypothetical protein [Bythopirellula polymerisocia]|uniref:Uncharacterized protein n=1 Tax=Bythopirellula polymerisocia TaxID=2528003 RepID=A0A5C6CRX6_9BACT|nr:hypothetical protein [Bythopirellula polymerisocia]TWU27252.1 hypothetical protein Pla144_20240 [Bythopirellula polymerisocia]